MPDGEKVVVKNLVLIDDDPISHFIFKALVTRAKPDLATKCYTSALVALGDIRASIFRATAIILDINMPRMTGWEFLTEMKKMQSNIPVYMLTSSTDKRDRMRITEFANVREYFVKPLVEAHLKNILENHFQ